MPITLGISLDPRTQELVSSATITPDGGNDDIVVVTAQAEALNIANPSGTPSQGKSIIIRLKDDGTGRAITFGAKYRALGITLPTTTVASKTMYIGMIYNEDDDKWDVIGLNEEA